MALRRLEYLPQLSDSLRSRGVAGSKVALFIQHWESLPPEDSYIPCPRCFVDGSKGFLQEQTGVGGIFILRCDTCSDQVLLRMK